MVYLMSYIQSSYVAPLKAYAVLLFGSFFTGLFSAFILLYFCIKAAPYLSAGVREFTPQAHQAKHATPVMGGLAIALATLIATFIGVTPLRTVSLFLPGALGCALIGLWDDLSKIIYKRGIRESFKMIGLVVVALVIAWWWHIHGQPLPVFTLPFTTMSCTHPLVSAAWIALVLCATTNAVNLTDGLDGLAAGVMVPNILLFGLAALIKAAIMFVSSTGQNDYAVLAQALGALLGALCSFLWFNTHPARIFMGDCGSLFLGGFLAISALLLRLEWFLLISAGVYVIETLSVIVQVGVFKVTGKRLFAMAPLHHHFELRGYKETLITGRFTLIAWLCCLIAGMCMFAMI